MAPGTQVWIQEGIGPVAGRAGRFVLIRWDDDGDGGLTCPYEVSWADRLHRFKARLSA